MVETTGGEEPQKPKLSEESYRRRLDLNLLVSRAVIETMAVQANGRLGTAYRRDERVEELLTKIPHTEMKALDIQVRKIIEFLGYLEGTIEW